MSVTRDLATVLTECTTSGKFHAFLVKNSLLTEQDDGLLTSSEVSIETETLPLTELLMLFLSKERGWHVEERWTVKHRQLQVAHRLSEKTQISEEWVRTHCVYCFKRHVA